MVDMRKYTSILTFRTQHSTRSVYLERATNCSSSLGQMYFSFSTKRIHFTVNTKSKNTKQQCVHLGVRDTPHPQIYFSFGKTLISVLTSKLNHSWFQKNRTKNSPSWPVVPAISKCSTTNKAPSNADAYFESTKIKSPTFLKHCLSKQWCV